MMLDVGFARERLVLTALLVSMLFVLGPVAPSSYSPLNLPLYFALLLLLVLFAGLTGRFRQHVDGFQAALAATGVWMLAATVDNEPAHWPTFLVWESGILLGLYAASSFGRSFDHAFLCRVFAGVVVLQAVVCVVQFLVYRNGVPIIAADFFQALFPTPAEYSFRYMTGVLGPAGRLTVAPGTLWTVNGLGAWLAIAIPILLSGARRAHPRFYPALVVVSVLLLARNLVRTASAAAVLGIAVYFLCMRLSGKTRKAVRPSRDLYRIGGVILVGALLFALVDSHGRRSFPTAVGGRGWTLLSEDAGLRLRLIGAGIQGIADRSFLGWGHGNSARAMPPASQVVAGLSERMERYFSHAPEERLHAHNVYLMTAHDGGLPAALALGTAVAFVIGAFAKRRERWSQEEIGLAASVAAALFMSLFYGVMYVDLWPLFLFMLGCLAGAVRSDAVSAHER